MKKILTLLSTLMVLTGCMEVTKDEVTNNNYKFIGESEHWKAEYSYKGTEIFKNSDGTKTYSNEDSYDLVIKYKGSLEELSSMKKLEYSYKSSNSSGTSTKEFTIPPEKLIFTSGSSENGVKVNENEVIQMNIKWDEFEESFELHNKRK